MTFDDLEGIKLYPAWELEDMETLSVGQETDLKYDDGEFRYNLSRCSIADGTLFNNTVYVERLINNRWVEVLIYDGDNVSNFVIQ